MKSDLFAQTFLTFLVSLLSVPGRLRVGGPNTLLFFHKNYFALVLQLEKMKMICSSFIIRF